MQSLLVLALLLCPVALYAEEVDTQPAQKEPRLYDHYLALQHMQESLARRSLEEQARLQPEINQIEQRACQQVRREREVQVPREQYRREGGDSFFVFAEMLEQYCQTVR